MSNFIDAIMRNLIGIDWEGPAMFAIIFLTLLAILRQWHVLLITLLTIVLGWGVQDLIIMNIGTNTQVMSVSVLIYCIGSGLGLILILISFFKLAI